MVGGASGRARNWRGRVLRSARDPGDVCGARAGRARRFGRDFSLAEIGRSGVEAMHVVVERLGIDAEHVIFGHIHRRGPLLDGEDGRSATDPSWERRGTTLHNTGCWIYVERDARPLLRRARSGPGRVIVVAGPGAPEAREVLADAAHAGPRPSRRRRPETNPPRR